MYVLLSDSQARPGRWSCNHFSSLFAMAWYEIIYIYVDWPFITPHLLDVYPIYLQNHKLRKMICGGDWINRGCSIALTICVSVKQPHQNVGPVGWCWLIIDHTHTYELYWCGSEIEEVRHGWGWSGTEKWKKWQGMEGKTRICHLLVLPRRATIDANWQTSQWQEISVDQ